MSAKRRLPVSRIASCAAHDAAHSPRGFYVLGLYGWCREEICGSTLIGWFAVQKASGQVFEWDVAEDKLGPSIEPQP